MFQSDTYILIKAVWKQDDKYIPGKPGFDIALVQLKSRFKWSKTVKPACLPTSSKLVKEYKGSLMVMYYKWFLIAYNTSGLFDSFKVGLDIIMSDCNLHGY